MCRMRTCHRLNSSTLLVGHTPALGRGGVARSNWNLAPLAWSRFDSTMPRCICRPLQPSSKLLLQHAAPARAGVRQILNSSVELVRLHGKKVGPSCLDEGCTSRMPLWPCILSNVLLARVRRVPVLVANQQRTQPRQLLRQN